MSTVDYGERKKGDNLTQVLGINAYVYTWLTIVDTVRTVIRDV